MQPTDQKANPNSCKMTLRRAQVVRRRLRINLLLGPPPPTILKCQKRAPTRRAYRRSKKAAHKRLHIILRLGPPPPTTTTPTTSTKAPKPRTRPSVPTTKRQRPPNPRATLASTSIKQRRPTTLRLLPPNLGEEWRLSRAYAQEMALDEDDGETISEGEWYDFLRRIEEWEERLEPSDWGEVQVKVERETEEERKLAFEEVMVRG